MTHDNMDRDASTLECRPTKWICHWLIDACVFHLNMNRGLVMQCLASSILPVLGPPLNSPLAARMMPQQRSGCRHQQDSRNRGSVLISSFMD